MKRFSRTLSALVGTVMALTLLSHASSPYELRTPQGEALQFRVRQYANENHQAEIAVAIREEHTFVPDGWVDVLYGRDLDGDGLAELWFAVDNNGGLQIFERDSHQADGWDVASDMLENELNIRGRSRARQIFTGLYTTLTLSGAARESSLRNLMRTEMDLRELEIRADRMRRQDPKNPSLASQYRLISEGWAWFGGTVVQKEIRDEFLWVVADGVTLGMGGAILRGAGAALKAVTPKFVIEYSEKLYARYVAQAASRSSAALEEAEARAATRAEESATVEAAARSASRLGIRERLAMQIRALTARSTAARALADAAGRSLHTLAKTLGGAIRGGAAEWKYIAGTETLQLAAEIFNNRETLFDSDPIILAERVADDKDLLQNLGFMTVETFNAAAVSSQVPSIKGRLAIGAVLSTANSTATSYFVKGQTDPRRMALDTGWEVVIGNSQVQLDFAALKYFDGLALKSGNSKLRLLGWVAVTVNQITGSTLVVQGNFTHNGQSLRGNLDLYGNLTVGTGAWFDVNSATATVLHWTGSSNSTYTFGASGQTTHLNIDKSGGASVSAAGGTTALSAGSLTVTSGTFNHPSGTLTLQPLSLTGTTAIKVAAAGTLSIPANATTVLTLTGACGWPGYLLDIASGSIAFENLTLSANTTGCGFPSISPKAGTTVSVNKSFVTDNTAAYLFGTWNLYGNATIGSTLNGNNTGWATFNFASTTANQTLTASASNFGHITVNKGATALNFASAVTNNNSYAQPTNMNFTLTSGTVNLNNFNLTLNGTLTLQSGTVINRGTGVITQGTLVNNGTIN